MSYTYIKRILYFCATLLFLVHSTAAADDGIVKCTPHPLDLAFIIDASTSLGPENYEKMKSFLQNVTSSLHISSDAARVALISFSTVPHLEFNLRDNLDSKSLRNAISNLKYHRGFTSTGPAVRMARKDVFGKQGRKDATQLTVVVTDGRTNYPSGRKASVADLKVESDKLKKEGVRIHGVGVGNILIKQDLEVMSSEGKYFMVNDFDGLLNLADEISKDICEVTCSEKQESIHGLCHKGTERVTHVHSHYREKQKRCEKDISYEYKFCSSNVKCKEVDVTLGNCINGIREVVTSWEEFDHDAQKCVEKRAVEKLSCEATEQCKEPIADIMIVVDSSGSVTVPDWSMQLQFVIALMQQLKLGPNAIHIGLMSFSTRVRHVLRIGGHSYSSALTSQILRTPHDKGWTATGLALKTVQDEFARYGRPNVNKILILMTDGESNDHMVNSPYRPIPEASKLQARGINVMFIGIGKVKTNPKFKQELQAIATPPLQDNLFFVENFNQLKDWAQKISKETCESITPPNPSLCDLPPRRAVTECFNGVQKITEIRYEWDNAGRCTKKMLSHITNPCKRICADPATGNEYVEGESWVTSCHSFHCRAPSSATEPVFPNKQECAGFTTSGATECHPPKGVVGRPNQDEFVCKDNKGKMYDRCYCAKENNQVQLVIITADAKAPRP